MTSAQQFQRELVAPSPFRMLTPLLLVEPLHYEHGAGVACDAPRLKAIDTHALVKKPVDDVELFRNLAPRACQLHSIPAPTRCLPR